MSARTLSMGENKQFEDFILSNKHNLENIAKSFYFGIRDTYNIFKDYFRLEVSGLENIPEHGNGLIVPNHSNASGLDAIMLHHVIRENTVRTPKIMAHHFWFSDIIRNTLMRKMEMFPADLREGLNNLKKKELVIIFPEAEDGNFKISSNMYKLVDFNPGFVPLAIMQKAPVIPTVIIGAEESNINLGKVDWFKGILGADVPILLNLIPFPVKWKIKFLKPIHFNKYNKKDIRDARFVKEINQNIRYRIQHEIDKELKNRHLVF